MFSCVVVLCPLSVVDGWISEVDKFCPELKVLRYIGDKETRRSLRRTVYDHVKKHKSKVINLIFIMTITFKMFIFGNDDIWIYATGRTGATF